jgi:hypothetical protein
MLTERTKTTLLRNKNLGKKENKRESKSEASFFFSPPVLSYGSLPGMKSMLSFK